MKFRIKFFDILIILFVIGLISFAVYNAYFKPRGISQILVRGQNSEWIFPQNAEENIIITGPLGNTVIRLSDNRAWVEKSPCHNQTCVATGKITRQGQWAACLPNNVLLMIYGSSNAAGLKDDIDVVAW